MGKEMKNVIVFKNIYSQFFDEVIFVLKSDKGTAKQNPNMVYEARKIIEDYINRQNSYNNQPKEELIELKGMERGNKLNAVLNASLILAILLFAMLVMKLF